MAVPGEHQLSPKEELAVLNQTPARCVEHFPSPTTAAAAWLDQGNGFVLEGIQFPPQLHPQLKESMHGWLSFSCGMASKLSINEPQEEHGMR